MKNFYGKLLMYFGIGVAALFGYLIARVLFEAVQTGEIDPPLLIKLIALFGVGIFDIVLGYFYLTQEVFPKEEPYLTQKDGHTYVKLGGSYVVGYTRTYFFTYYLALFLSIILMVFYYANTLRTKNDIRFLLLGYVLILAFFINVLYFMNRPRIVVKEETCICYPRWAKKKVISIGEISEREVSKQGPFQRMYVTYYSFGKEIIMFPLTLENAVRLDVNVYQRMSYKKTAEQ